MVRLFVINFFGLEIKRFNVKRLILKVAEVEYFKFVICLQI
jgi:hypothetical protein